MNEQKGVDVDNFLSNYIYDETIFIYEVAKEKGEIIEEHHVM